MPYKNGKKDGVVLLFKSKQPHHLADKSPFVDGKRDGTQETWLVDKQSGHPWQLKKSEYSSGKKHGETITYRKDGTLKYSSMFNYGKVTTQCSYRKDGTLMECIHK